MNKNKGLWKKKFKAMARCSLERVTGFKRAKDTSHDVGVSPDTIRDRPGSKVAKRVVSTGKINSKKWYYMAL